MTVEVDALDVRVGPGELRLRVKLKPGAAHDAVAGIQEGALLLRLRARPVEGAANESLLRFLGRLLGVPPSRIALVGGARSRLKTVSVSGLGLLALRARLAASDLAADP